MKDKKGKKYFLFTSPWVKKEGKQENGDRDKEPKKENVKSPQTLPFLFGSLVVRIVSV